MSSTATTSMGSLEKLHLGYSRDRHLASCVPWIARANNIGCCNSRRRHLDLFTINHRGHQHSIKMNLNAANNLTPGLPVPSGSGSPFPHWSRWMWLTLLGMIFPFFKGKWGPLTMIKKEMSTTIAAVDTMAEMIEEIAVKVDKMADHMAENLPEGSNLRKVVDIIDDIAEETIKGADCVEELLDKVEEAGNRMEKIIEQSMKNKAVEEEKKKA